MKEKTLGLILPACGAYAAGTSKYRYLLAGKAFLREVARELTVAGITLADTKIGGNPGGPAVEGEATLHARRGDRVLWAMVCPNYGDRNRAALLWRVGRKPYATDAANQRISDPGATPAVAAATIARLMRDL